MTQEEVKMRAELYSALAEGKIIQLKRPNGTWKDVRIDELSKIYNSDNYRIKPESRYRPFKDKEECWQEMQKHHPFGWVIDKHENFQHIALVYSCDSDNGDRVGLSVAAVSIDFGYMLKDFKFADGTPFGIKE